MRLFQLIFLLVFFTFSNIDFAEAVEYVSTVRQGKAVVAFRNIDMPQQVEQGEVLPLYVTFFVEDYIGKSLKFFLHLLDSLSISHNTSATSLFRGFGVPTLVTSNPAILPASLVACL